MEGKPDISDSVPGLTGKEMAYVGLPVGYFQAGYLGIENVQPVYDVQKFCNGKPYPQEPVFEESWCAAILRYGERKPDDGVAEFLIFRPFLPDYESNLGDKSLKSKYFLWVIFFHFSLDIVEKVSFISVNP